MNTRYSADQPACSAGSGVTVRGTLRVSTRVVYAPPKSIASSNVSANTSRAAEAITASGSTVTIGLYRPPVSAMSASVKMLSAALTSHANRVRRTSRRGLASSSSEYAMARPRTTNATATCWRTQSGPMSNSTPIEATTAVRTATTMRAMPRSSWSMTV